MMKIQLFLPTEVYWDIEQNIILGLDLINIQSSLLFYLEIFAVQQSVHDIGPLLDSWMTQTSCLVVSFSYLCNIKYFATFILQY